MAKYEFLRRRRPAARRTRRFAAVLGIEHLEGRALLATIAQENLLPGSPPSQWDISGSQDTSIMGFTTDISVNAGQMVSFKVNTDATNYHIDIYRLGYYQGNGAAFKASVPVSLPTPQFQPPPRVDPTTGLVDAGNWSVSATWAVPADATSGVYVAKVVRDDTGGASHIYFVVRNDASRSDLLLQTSDTTWQAYNEYGFALGGGSLYVGSAPSDDGRAYKVSYNRPLDDNSSRAIFWYEYPMIRWLEANGYDVTYTTALDTDRRGAATIGQHRVFISAGHDEYWSAGERANVEAARAAGVSLAFFSGNATYWKVRWENSIDGTNTPYRTMICYKDTQSDTQLDPSPQGPTGTWADPMLGGANPQNALTGSIFRVNGLQYSAIQVPSDYAPLRFWRNTSIASLGPGQVGSLVGTLGTEWDEDRDNGFRPAGLIDLSLTTQYITGAYLLDYGKYYEDGQATHSLTLYRDQNSRALVFGAGTTLWVWGLDGNHDTGGLTSSPDPIVQQATVNLLADMGAQPATLQAGLVRATASTDTVGPTVTITSPTNNATVQGSPVTITGTATDQGGGVVAGIEVSVDGGVTWHPAVGRGNWSYSWVPSATGTATIKVRATDDSANIGAISTINVTVAQRTGPSTIWPGAMGAMASAINTASLYAPASFTSDAALEVGVQFTSDVAGTVSGIRFYQGPGNPGPHVGHLWTSDGQLLAMVNFTSETGSGWQTATFSSPVAIQPGVMYVASYHTNGYAYTMYYFGSTQNVPFNDPPLHALNGVYRYDDDPRGVGAPDQSYRNTNYWIDLVFNPASSPAPFVTSANPADGATGVPTNTTVQVAFSQSMDASTINTSTFQLRDASGNPVGATVSYNASTNMATLTPTSALANLSTYTVFVQGGPSGVKSTAGVAMATNFTASFTTAAAAPTVTSTSPANGATNIATNTTVLVTFSQPMDASTITTSTVQLRNPSGNAVAATVTYDASSNSARLTPTSALANSTTYTIFVQSGASGVKNTFGVPLASNYTASFTTIAAPAAPTVTTVSPADGATDVPTNATVRVTFSQPMNTATFTTSTFQLRNASGSTVPTTFSYDSTTNTAILTPSSALANSASYTIFVQGGTSGVKSSAGVPLASNFTASFTTAAAVPRVTATSPADGATDVPTNATVRVTFSQPMNTATFTTSTFQLRNASGSTVPTTFSYDSTTNTAILTPSSALANSASYTIFVQGGTSGVKSSAGVPLASNFTASFTTAAAVPRVTATNPANGASNVNPNTTVQVTFSQPMNASTITTSTIQLRNSSNVAVGATVTYNTSTNTATLTPTSPLANSSTYTIFVRGGSNGVKSTAGVAMTANYTASFTTAAALRVTGSSPANGATNVAINTTAQVTFSQPMSASTFTTSTFQLRDPSGNPVVSTFSYNASTNTATLTPTSALNYSTTYTIFVQGGSSGVKSVYGVALDTSFSASFRTVAAPAAPTVTATSPVDGSTGVDPNTTVQVTFSQPMIASTINTSTFQLQDASGNSVAATVTYDATSSKATLTPSSALNSGTTYTIFVQGGSGGVQSTAGVPMAATFSASFTTITTAAAPTITASYPADGDTNVPINTTVQVSFDQPMDPSLFTTAFQLLDSSGNTVPTTFSYDSTTNTAILTPTGYLYYLATYTIFVQGGPGGVTSTAGVPLDTTFTASFTTDPPASRPQVTRTSLPSDSKSLNGAANIPIDLRSTGLWVVFSQGMDWSTVTASTLQLRDETGRAVPTTIEHIGSNIAVLKPTGLLNNAALYTIYVQGGPHGVKNSSGEKMLGNYTSSFTTVAAPSWVTGTNPANGATGVDRGQSITVTFNVPMNPATINTSTVQLIDSAGHTEDVTLSYNSTTHTVTIDKRGQLNRLDTYRIVIRGVQNTKGITMPDFISTFTTGGNNDSAQPTVVSTSPDDHATNVPTSTAVRVTFSQPMNWSTFNNNRFQLRNAAGNPVAATISFDTETNTAILTPNAPLANGATYTIYVQGGPSGVKGPGGEALAADFTSSFTTAVSAPAPAPTVIRMDPSDGTSNVDRGRSLTVTFDLAMDPTSINENTIQLIDSADRTENITVLYDATTRAVTIDPRGQLKRLENYRIVVKGGPSGVKSAAGIAMAADVISRFTTGS
ncbi:MAG: Ig-like domain-containing protein [Isosphaeraceae bacterium]|nr:Ig-like domain-containing protein [Isosphaeraceae bacterium]